MSLDIQAARAVYKIAAEKLKNLSAPEEVRLAVEMLDIVLDELEAQSKTIGDLRGSMIH